MQYWLMKSEPSVYSWHQFVTDKKTDWTGVRNHQANNNMKAMRLGDRAFFYHSNDERAIVGIADISGLWRSDPDADAAPFGMVEVAASRPLKNPVALSLIKRQEALHQMVLLRQSRLSVSPVTKVEWDHILGLSATASVGTS